MKNKTGIFVVFIIALLFCPYSPAEAFDNSPEMDIQRDLLQSRDILESINMKLGQVKDATSEITRLKALSDSIMASHQLLQEKFRTRGEELTKSSATAYKRHVEMSENFRKFLEEYLPLVEMFGRGSSRTKDIDYQRELVRNIIALLDKNIYKKARPIYRGNPYQNRTSDYFSKEPDQSPAILPAYQGGDQSVSPDDLKSTAEAPLSAEIASFAQSLDWNPVSIYEYVKNMIDTEWYWGCMKGAEETLRQKSGNDCDQSSLLIALLRASGFPSRYVKGVIEFFPSVETAKNLTGIDDPLLIAEFFRKSGIPFTPVIAGGRIDNLQIEHIWVESLIPYANYRGAVLDEHGKTWLGLDTGIKAKGYLYNTPPDIFGEIDFSGIRSEYLSTLQIKTPLEYIRSYTESWLAQNHPGVAYQDILRTRTLLPEIMDILPAGLQFRQTKITHEYAEIPAALKHQARFTAKDSNNNELFAITMDMLNLSNRRITLSHEPETVEDQEIINSYGGMDNTPAYLVRLRPAMTVDGERVVIGRDGLPMGADYTLTTEIISPNAKERITATHIAGDLSIIGIVAQKARGNTLTPISEEDDAEEILYKVTNKYIDQWNRAEDELASLTQLTLARPVPAVTTTGGVIDVTYVLDTPHEFQRKGIYIDAALRAASLAPNVKRQKLDERQKTFMQLSALQGSVLEHRIFEDNFQVDSISTAKLFQIANMNQIPLQTIDKTNAEAVVATLPFDSGIREDILNSANRNARISIPMSEITYQDWTGIGYIKESPETGEAGYMLSGTIAGGNTAQALIDWALQYIRNKLAKPNSNAANNNPMAAGSIIKIAVTNRQYGIAGGKLAQPLSVLVLDKDSKPVQGAVVTFRMIAGGGNIYGADTYITRTGQDGIASAALTFGQKTAENPVYRKIKITDQFPTQMGLNIVTAAVNSWAGKIALSEPFEAYGKPGQPKEIIQAYGGGSKSLVNNPAGSLRAVVADQYGNPISNLTVTFRTLSTTSMSADVPLPAKFRTVQFYRKKDCGNPYPLYGECATEEELQVTTEYSGAIAETMLGNTVNTKYIVEASAGGTGITPALFKLYTDGKRVKDGYLAPGLYIRHLAIANDKGEPADATKAGTQLRMPLISEMFTLMDDYTMEGPYTCVKNNQPRNCWRIKPSGIVNTAFVNNASVTYTATQGGGSCTTTDNLGNGKYLSRHVTGSTPSVNKITSVGEAQINVPEVFYDPATNMAITEDYETAVLPQRNVLLQSGQEVLFNITTKDPIKTNPEAAVFIVYGVDIKLSFEPGRFILNEKGSTSIDTVFQYIIQPPEYQAITADIDIFKNNNYAAYLIGDKTKGDGNTLLVAGTAILTVDDKYEAQAVLNRGTGIEIKSNKVPLPVGQFRMVTDDAETNPVVGLVTDGTATARLQLTVKHNQQAFNGLAWQVIDPDVLDYTSSEIRGTFLNGGTPVDTIPVIFNSNGISEAVYRAPETFVRWGYNMESDDKERPERLIQPTLDVTGYLKILKDPLTPIRIKRPPVVLVHGLWGNGLKKHNDYAWKIFEPKLNNKMIYDIFSVDYHETGQVNSIKVHAPKLQIAIDDAIEIMKAQQFAAAKVDIIAHSLGGLLTREYCFQNKAECQNKIRRFITIATPHFGSELADLLLVYRDQNNFFPNNNYVSLPIPIPLSCKTRVNMMVRGEWGVEAHPILPKGGAIDDLATGKLPDFLNGATVKGRWFSFPPLSDTLHAHTIIGETPEPFNGFTFDIDSLWKYALIPCGFTRSNVFDNLPNDRIVRSSSQQEELSDNMITKVDWTDHFTVKTSIQTTDKVKFLLDQPYGFGSFTRE
jgi:pimeloyl-ACP methyl ester carboxylesterase